MAWNKYYIVVTNQSETEPAKAFEMLGLTGFQLREQTNFPATNKSNDLFVGRHMDNLIFANPNLVYSFFSDSPGEMEQKFVRFFPDSVIAVFIENSSVGEFGYSIIEGGQRIRMVKGSDGEIYHDVGAMLLEENVIRSGDIFEPEELDEMREEMNETEVQNMIIFEASWRVPEQLSKRYFGKTIEDVAEEIKLSLYVKS